MREAAGRRTPKDEEAVSGLFALLIATTFVAVTFGSISYATISSVPTEDETSRVQLNADLLALDLVEMPGGTLDLTDGDTVDPDVLEELQGALHEPVADDVTDYEEAAEELGFDFHLRLWPLLDALETTLASGGDLRLQVLYVADFESGTPSDVAQQEIDFLDALVAGFDASDHVLPDDQHLTQPIRERLDPAHVLLIGSHVDLSRLLPVQQRVRDWIAAGGALIVLGNVASDDTVVRQLMAPGHSGAHHALADPDTGHPALHSPNRIDAATIPVATTPGAGAHADAFARVTSDDGLFVSNPGAHGEGRVVVTAWTPGADTAAPCQGVGLGADCQGLRALHNLLAFGYTDLYLDYGPSLPDHGGVDSARRTVAIDHPRRGHVDLALLVLTY